MKKVVGAFAASSAMFLSPVASATNLALLHARERLAIEAYAGSQPGNNPGRASRCHITGHRGRRVTCWVSFALIAEPGDLLIGYMSQWDRAFEQGGQIYQKRIGPWHVAQACSNCVVTSTP